MIDSHQASQIPAISCIIIDDEPRARNLLEVIIKDYCPQLHVKELCADLPSGVKAIRKQKPQLVFLDIEMPGHSGLEILDFFNDEEVNFDIIFTTAYNEYALQAFKISAVDFLLKPIQHTQLLEAIQRYLKRANHHTITQQVQALRSNLDATTNWESKRVVVPSGQAMHFLNPSDIILIKGEAAYSEIYLSNGSTIMASKNLKHFEEMLTPIPIFLRSHKSYIVNVRYIDSYVKSDGGFLQLNNGMQAGISPDKVEQLLLRIK